ncbi:hypothetical protein PINS_up010881 [Pythium insidiosum]|nr:hypothetical protein PINS_up010881 [Pythium insidiosum]
MTSSFGRNYSSMVTRVSQFRRSLLLPQLRLHLTDSSFLVIWWFVVLLHIASLMAFARRAVNYTLLLCVPAQQLATAQFGVELNQPITVSSTVLWSIVSALHLGALVRIAFCSCSARRPMFPEASNRVAPEQAHGHPAPRKKTVIYRITSRRWRAVLRRWVWRPLDRVLYGIDKFLEPVSMTGRHFELAFNSRELVEIVFQGLQAYFMSESVPYKDANRAQVAVCVTNCWSTPIIQHFYSHDRLLERLLCVVADTFCTFLTMVVAPSVVASIYGNDYSLGAPHTTFLMQNKINQLLCNSWMELGLNISGAYFLSSGLKAIKSIAKPPPRDVDVTASQVIHKLISMKPPRRNASAPNPVILSENVIALRQTHQSIGSRVWHITMLAIGGLILGFHVHTQRSRGEPPRGCRIELYPWLRSRSNCAVIEINCGIEGIHGREPEIDPLFQNYQLDVIKVLVFSNCSQLEMPRVVQRLPNLYRLDVFNSTLSSWSHDAAVSRNSNPALGQIVLARVRNMSTWPQGLSYDSLPSSLRQIYVCDTDLVVLPDSAVQQWPYDMLMVTLEQSALTELPASLATKHLHILSLARSRLKALPSEIADRNSLEYLSVAGTQLESLPVLAGSGAIAVLDVSYTNVSSIPASWWPSRSNMVVRASQSPLCAAQGDTTLGFVRDCSPRDEKSLLLFPVHSYEVI